MAKAKGRTISLLLCIFLVLFLIKMLNIPTQKNKLLGAVDHKIELFKPSCQNVIDKMVTGHWVKKDVSQDEIDEVENFHRKVRTFHGIPQSLQRGDNRCGALQFDVEMKKNAGLTWFRALCNPVGSEPCCFEHKCILRSIEECRCKHCYDVRQQIHAELHTWIPADPICKITKFVDEKDTCKVLRDVTIYFIGDSFMRQLYISVVSLVRSKNYGPLQRRTPRDKLKLCDRYYRVTSECTPWIINDSSECNDTTRLRRISFWKADKTDQIHKFIGELQGQPNSFVVLGAGIHEGFDLNIVQNEILRPLLHLFAKFPWPKPIWLSTHSPGLLKAPKFALQQTENVKRYNLRINDILRTSGIPVMDFYQMTQGVMSYDGTHYGPGINDLKAQIFLNYILEIRSNIAKV